MFLTCCQCEGANAYSPEEKLLLDLMNWFLEYKQSENLWTGFSASVFLPCRNRVLSYSLCLCELACAAVLCFHFVLADAGKVSAPYKLKSRFMVVFAVLSPLAVMCCYIYSVVLCCRHHFDNSMTFLKMCFHFFNSNLYHQEPNPQNSQRHWPLLGLFLCDRQQPLKYPLFYGTCMEHIFLAIHNYTTHNAWGLLLPSGVWVVRLIQELLWRSR